MANTTNLPSFRYFVTVSLVGVKSERSPLGAETLEAAKIEAAKVRAALSELPTFKGIKLSREALAPVETRGFDYRVDCYTDET